MIKHVSNNVDQINISLFASLILKHIKLYEFHVLKMFFLRSQKTLSYLKIRNNWEKKENHEFFEKIQQKVEINNQTRMKIQCIYAKTWFTKQVKHEICMKIK